MHQGVGTVARSDGMAFSGNRSEIGSNRRTTMGATLRMSPILTVGPESRWRVVLTGGRLGLPSNHEPHRRTSRAIAISGGSFIA
jgi:hypothetical protein